MAVLVSVSLACSRIALAATVVSTIPVGAGPVHIALSPTTSRAYVTNRDSDSVSVIDTNAHAVITTVSVQSAPVGIAVRPDDSEVWVVNRLSGTLTIINAVSLTMVATINVGGLPDAIVFSHDGSRAYVTNDTSFAVAIVDVISRSIIGSIPTPGFVGESLLITPDDRIGYLAEDQPDGPILRTEVLDLSSGSVIGEIEDTWLTAFSHRGPTAWGFQPVTNTVSLVHLNRPEVRTTVSVSPRPISLVLSTDGKRLYVASDLSNEITILNAISGKLLETLSVGGRPTDIVVLPSGTLAYVAQLDAGSVAILSL